MSIENKNFNESKDVSPFDIEKIEEIKIPNAKVDGMKLFIDGNEQEKYSAVTDQKNLKSDPNLLYFNAVEKSANLDGGRIIDINNPDKELVFVDTDKNGDTFVNGRKWDSLRNKKVYFGGFHVEVDPEVKNIVFRGMVEDSQGSSRRTYYVISNNQTWNTKFNEFNTIATNGETVYSFGGEGEGNKLVIDDKEWIYNRQNNKEYHNGIDKINNAKVSKKGTVVAIIDSLRQNKDTRRFISIGDKTGEKSVWENTFAVAGYERPNLISIDDESGNIAVFGQVERDGKTELLINDIPYEISGNPEKLEYMDFEDGSLVIQYENALGEKTTEKISLREDSKTVQEMKEKKENEEKVFGELRRLLAQENITANEIVARLKKAEDLSKETEKTKNLSEIVNGLVEEKTKLQMQIEQNEKAHKDEIRNLEVKNTNAEMALKKLESILKGAGKVTMSSNFKLSPEDMKLALDSIQKALEK